MTFVALWLPLEVIVARGEAAHTDGDAHGDVDSRPDALTASIDALGGAPSGCTCEQESWSADASDLVLSSPCLEAPSTGNIDDGDDEGLLAEMLLLNSVVDVLDASGIVEQPEVEHG